ncbi:MAG: hypothetical protein ACKV0T_28640 [Planctomycetales bacterium]
MSALSRRIAFWLVVASFAGTIAVVAIPRRNADEMDELLAAYRAFGQFVVMAEDPRAWSVLESAARRANPRLRMLLIESVNRWHNADPQQQLPKRFAFLIAFLDDRTKRVFADSAEKFERPSAGDDFPELEIRNLAAESLASLLGFDDDPKPDWTLEQWTDLRDRVRRKASRALDPGGLRSR